MIAARNVLGRIDLVAGQTITILLSGSGATPLSDPYLRLRDASGNLLVENDDSGGSLNSTVNFTATTTGTYYIDAAAWAQEAATEEPVAEVAFAGEAAAAGAEWSKSFYQILTNQPGADSWPITGATFILMHKNQDKPAEAAAALKFFEWAYKNGDKTADDLDYVPMPSVVKAQIEKAWGEIKDASGKPIAYK